MNKKGTSLLRGSLEYTLEKDFGMEIEAINGEYRVCRIPGLIATQKNTLLAYYECRRGDSSDWAEIDIKIIRSRDRGESWETVKILKGDGATLNNPVMIAQDEKIHFLFCKDYKRVFYAVSRDDGKSFSEPVELVEPFQNADFFYNAVALGPGHGIFFGGKLLIPVWFAYNRERHKAHHPSFVCTLCSEDGGAHWFFGEPIQGDDLKDPNESALAQNADGGVMISIRSESSARCRAIATSSNGVDHWSAPEFVPSLRDPVCQGSVISYQGLLLHINCDSDSKREALTVKVLDRELRLRGSVLVDEIGGYSDLAIVKDELCVLYERGALHGKGGLHFLRIPLSSVISVINE